MTLSAHRVAFCLILGQSLEVKNKELISSKDYDEIVLTQAF